MTNLQSDPLQQLLDIEAIRQLKARYFRSIDRKEWDDFGQVLARDAVLEVPEGGIVERGREQIVESLRKTMAELRTVHQGFMPEIEVTGPDNAKGTWAMSDYVEWPPSPSGSRSSIRGYGHYLEEYVREEGEWRISRIHLTRLRVDALDIGPA